MPLHNCISDCILGYIYNTLLNLFQLKLNFNTNNNYGCKDSREVKNLVSVVLIVMRISGCANGQWRNGKRLLDKYWVYKERNSHLCKPRQ